MKNKKQMSNQVFNNLVINEYANKNIVIMYSIMLAIFALLIIFPQEVFCMSLLICILVLPIILVYPIFSDKMKLKFLIKLQHYNAEIIKDLKIATVDYSKVSFGENMIEFCSSKDPIHDGIQTSLNDYNANLRYLKELMNELELEFSKRMDSYFLDHVYLLLIKHCQDNAKTKKIHKLISVGKALELEKAKFIKLLEVRQNFQNEIELRLNKIQMPILALDFC